MTFDQSQYVVEVRPDDTVGEAVARHRSITAHSGMCFLLFGSDEASFSTPNSL